MKILQNFAALLLVLTILAGMGYGVYSGYHYLVFQWEILVPKWRPVIILGGAILFFCTLVVVWAVSSGARSNALATGRGVAYDAFIDWYGALVHDPKNIHAGTFISIRNRMALWAGNEVAREADILYNALKDKQSHEALLKHAGNVFREMKKEMGNRSLKEFRKIV